MWFRSVIFLLLLGAEQASAGAWMREEGDTFIATGGNFWLSDGTSLPVNYDPTVYAEYGLAERMTIGLDFHTADRGTIISGFGFAKVPLGPNDGRYRLAGSVALGLRYEDGREVETQLRGGLHWGMGLDDGWLAVDASATVGNINQIWRPKADFTWGHNWSEKWTTTLQIQTGQGYAEDTYAKVNPNIIYNFSDDMRINLGAVRALTGDKGFALKLETWISF